MKKRLKIFLIALCAAIALPVAAVLGFGKTAVANADDKTVTSIDSVSSEVLYYGEKLETKKATVHFSDGSSEERDVIWENLDATKLNTNFTSIQAIGTVSGTNQKVKRSFFTMPRGLVYFINCGSYTGQPVTETKNENDIYWDLSNTILTTYEGGNKLINKTADKMTTEHNVSGIADSGNWGYVNYNATFKVSSKQAQKTSSDPIPPDFPYNTIRSNNVDASPYGYTYELDGLDASKSYRMYLGTRSHWHSRTVTTTVNGVSQGDFQCDSVPIVTVYNNLAATGGKLTIDLHGRAGENQANSAFIAIQPMEDANQIPAAPEGVTVDGNIKLGATRFTVHGAKAGVKVQVAEATRPYNVIHEQIPEADGDCEIVLPADRMSGVLSLRIATVTGGGASDPVIVYITDIADGYIIEPRTTAFTADDVAVHIKAQADSTIKRLVVTHDFVPVTYTEEEDPKLGLTEYDADFMISQNGEYEFTLYSGNGAYVSKVVKITNIDKVDVGLTVSMAVVGFTGNKPRVQFEYTGATPAEFYSVYNSKGEEVASGGGVPEAMTLNYDRYSFSVTSESGKVATANIVVSENGRYFTATAKSVQRGVSYTFNGANGKTIDPEKLLAYTVNPKTGIATVQMTIGMTVANYTGNPMYVQVVYTDGTVEFARVNAQPDVTVVKKGCGSAAAAASLPIAALALCACALVVGLKRKRVRG